MNTQEDTRKIRKRYRNRMVAVMVLLFSASAFGSVFTHLGGGGGGNPDGLTGGGTTRSTQGHDTPEIHGSGSISMAHARPAPGHAPAPQSDSLPGEESAAAEAGSGPHVSAPGGMGGGTDTPAGHDDGDNRGEGSQGGAPVGYGPFVLGSLGGAPPAQGGQQQGGRDQGNGAPPEQGEQQLGGGSQGGSAPPPDGQQVASNDDPLSPPGDRYGDDTPQAPGNDPYTPPGMPGCDTGLCDLGAPGDGGPPPDLITDPGCTANCDVPGGGAPAAPSTGQDIPEPASLLLLAPALVALGRRKLIRRNA